MLENAIRLMKGNEEHAFERSWFKGSFSLSSLASEGWKTMRLLIIIIHWEGGVGLFYWYPLSPNPLILNAFFIHGCPWWKKMLVCLRNSPSRYCLSQSNVCWTAAMQRGLHLPVLIKISSNYSWNHSSSRFLWMAADLFCLVPMAAVVLVVSMCCTKGPVSVAMCCRRYSKWIPSR